ncbi:Dimeric alpha-beta barrel [Phytophthora cactorum]|nr:Dimeric alpha-beta barrel [Phytophthora cactorum]
MVYTIVCHLYAKEGKDIEEKIRSKLVEASNVYVKDAGTLNWHVMQDHADPRKWTIVERYEKKSVRYTFQWFFNMASVLTSAEGSHGQPALRSSGLTCPAAGQEAGDPPAQRAGHESPLIADIRD